MGRRAATAALKITIDSELLGTLRALRDLTSNIDEAQANYKKRRARLDAEHEQLVGPMVAVKDQLQGDVAAWLRSRRDLLGATRSVTTIHGQIGLRTGAPKAVFARGKDHAATVLRARGLTEAFITREELSIDALRRLPPSELRQAGISFQTTESAYLRLPDGTAIPLILCTEQE